MPYMYALYVCPVRVAALETLLVMPHVLYICMPYMYALYVCPIRVAALETLRVLPLAHSKISA